VDHDVPPKLRKQTQWDEFVMLMFAAQGYKGNELRIEAHEPISGFLHAVTAANVAVADGSQVCDNSWKSKQNKS
jgi:uncharacterized protein YggL (DUF469 family)